MKRLLWKVPISKPKTVNDDFTVAVFSVTYTTCEGPKLDALKSHACRLPTQFHLLNINKFFK